MCAPASEITGWYVGRTVVLVGSVVCGKDDLLYSTSSFEALPDEVCPSVVADVRAKCAGHRAAAALEGACDVNGCPSVEVGSADVPGYK